MSELTVEQLIKIILGIFVVIAVVIGVYLIFKERVAEFLNSLSPGNSTKFFLALLK
jgi:hypothetical protein